jgi:hypothetical protein
MVTFVSVAAGKVFTEPLPRNGPSIVKEFLFNLATVRQVSIFKNKLYSCYVDRIQRHTEGIRDARGRDGTHTMKVMSSLR